ncbi:uncharacterized protein [Nicotiana tomentosiformis]|uniref:uncharacterized protein n=1 Tax=Nicotiana tomentosiformis TaxID=4098 RepID=UPI00388CA0EE
MVRTRAADVTDHGGAAPHIARGRGRGQGRAPARGRGRRHPRVVPVMPPVDLLEDPIIEEQGEVPVAKPAPVDFGIRILQRWWLELLKDYDITILYHLGKVNVVADALSRKAESMGSLAFISVEERPLDLDIQSLANRLVRLDILEPSQVLACIVAQSSQFDQIKAHEFDDPYLLVLRETGRLCVPNVDGLRERILEEAYNSQHSIHPSSMKMYHDLRQHYWWRRINDIVEYVARCLNCQRVKYEHQRPGVLLQ